MSQHIMPQQTIAIVGAGIVGLAHAWAAAKQGHRVLVFERQPRAQGATVRNFGMIWPVGQPAGETLNVALRSRKMWLRLARDAGVWVNPCGSLHLAHREDEYQVLREFCAASAAGPRNCRLLTKEETLALSPAANPSGLLGSMHSPHELCVNPRNAAAQIATWLQKRYGVEFHWSTTITQVDETHLSAADGRYWPVARTLICSGSDFEALFPHVLADSGLKRCKLQMLRTHQQPHAWRLGPHIASGLTLRHYTSFQGCPTLAALRERVATETPELDQFGIHVMASQNDAGEVVLGDSHEYDAQIDPFNKTIIDDLILRELRKIICLPDWSIAQRWDGQYAKHPAQGFFHAQPLENVDIFTGLGGAGMTMSLGLADRFWNINSQQRAI